MATVTLRDVSKVYPGRGGEAAGVRAVDRATLDIADGEFLVLVGPSGCGKSTLLRMIAGLEEISEGEVKIGGRRVNEVQPKDRDVAMVFQNYALYPHMTVEENLGFALKMRGAARDEIRRRVGEAAATLGMDKLLARRPKELSGGQMQRVAVGRAIVRDPEVFLFDEPLSNLDAKLRGEMRVELKRLHQRLGATMIYVTHDQVEAMTLGDRIVVMSGGLIQQVGAPLDIYDRPANRFVAGFLGSPPMNFVKGTVHSRGGAHHFAAPGVEVGIQDGSSAAGSLADGLAVELGIRPEDLELGDASGTRMSGTVDVVEPLGDELVVYARLADSGTDLAGGRFAPPAVPPSGGPLSGTIVAKLPPQARVAPGETIHLKPRAGKTHLFDTSGKAL